MYVYENICSDCNPVQVVVFCKHALILYYIVFGKKNFKTLDEILAMKIEISKAFLLSIPSCFRVSQCFSEAVARKCSLKNWKICQKKIPVPRVSLKGILKQI